MDLFKLQREVKSRMGRCKPMSNSKICNRPDPQERGRGRYLPNPHSSKVEFRLGIINADVSFSSNDPVSENENFTITRKTKVIVSENGCENLLDEDLFESRLFEALQQPFRRQWEPLLLFHKTKVKPIHTFKELPLRASVIKNLELQGKFSDLSQIQKWGIPVIRKQLDVVMVGGPKSGKTLAYLLPLVDYIQESSYFEELPRGNGPRIVIVSSSSKTCESIFYFCRKLLGLKASHLNACIKILVVHGGSEKKLHVQLTNGVDILIVTPHSLERLLAFSVITNFERLTCLVMDEIDVLSENPYRRSVRIILEKTKSRQVVQKIFVGEKWSVQVESLAERYAKNYTLIITSFEDIAVYKKLIPKIIFVEKSQKFKYLIGILKKKSQLGKIIIVCETEKEASKLKSCFQMCRYPAFTLSESFPTEKIQETIGLWKSSNPPILLITTDDILSEYNIANVNTIIHYSIPKKSKTNFFLRYSAYCNFNDTRRLSEGSEYKFNDVIFIDDQNHKQLPHILNFIKKIGGQIPEELASVSNEIWDNHERQKIDKKLCSNLLAFGSCRNYKNCSQRHVFIQKLDNFEGVGIRKWIKFSVLKVQDAACFYVSLTETFDENDRVKVPNYASEISRIMKTFYREAENRKTLADIGIGKVCGVKIENKEIFHRGKIVEFSKFDKFGHPTDLKVRLLDVGDVVTCKAIAILELPDELLKFPPSAIEVRVIGIHPLDFDISWSEESTKFVQDMMKRPLEINQFWCGQVVIALQDLLFLDQIMLKKSCDNVGVDVCEKKFQTEIMEHEFATKNTKHLPALRELCLQAEITLPFQKEGQNIDLKQPAPDWAFFDSKVARAKFSAAEGLQTVFLQSLEYTKSFEELEKELQKEGENRKRELVKEFPIFVGLYVMAKFEGKWNRGRIEAEENKRCKIFFVDYGDYWLISKEDILPIPNKFLTKLPLQAIECRLIGVQLQTKSSEEVLRRLYALCEDGYAILTALVVTDDEKPECSGGRKYAIELINEEGVSVNSQLMQSEFFEENCLKKKYFDNSSSLVKNLSRLNEFENSPVKQEAFLENETSFTHLSNEVFDDEDGILFLQEFASKVFNISIPISVPSLRNENIFTQTLGSLAQQEETPAEKNNVIETNSAQIVSKQKGNIKNLSRKKEKKDNNQNKSKVNLVPKKKIYTPKISWNQNLQDLLIKVDLADVKQYILHCSPKNLVFKGEVNGKSYMVDIRLFGVIVPQSTQVVVKAFQVSIHLKKLLKLPWTKLHADNEKFWWITWSAEEVANKNQMITIIDSVREDMNCGKVKRGVREKKVVMCSDSDFSDCGCPYSDSE